jgi:hypothetical protein
MRTVWKFPLQQITEIEVPGSANVNLVALDPATGDPALWMELDPSLARVRRKFAIYGTGHEIAGNGGYPSPIHVGSVVHGTFVWHVYEVRS